MSLSLRYALLPGIVGLIGVSSLSLPGVAANTYTPSSPVLIATAYTTQTLPTLRRGDSGSNVRVLQEILVSNGFLGAAGVRLGNTGATTADGIFGAVTESAIRDLQQRYNLPVTGIVDPATWEVLDVHENPYGAALPWLY